MMVVMMMMMLVVMLVRMTMLILMLVLTLMLMLMLMRRPKIFFPLLFFRSDSQSRTVACSSQPRSLQLDCSLQSAA